MADPRTTVLSSALEPAAAEKAELRRGELNGCPWHDVKSMLRDVGLRPTRQRMPWAGSCSPRATASDRRDAVRGGHQGQGPGVARHRLQHAAPVHRCGSAAPGRGRRIEDLLRYQHLDPPPLLRRRRQRAGGYSGRRRKSSASCPPRRPATRSHASTWSCACAARASNPGRIGLADGRALPGLLFLGRWNPSWPGTAVRRTASLRSPMSWPSTSCLAASKTCSAWKKDFDARHKAGHDETNRIRAMDPAAIDEVAKTFLRARQTGERLPALPARLAPGNFADSCAVMDAVDRLIGEPISAPKSPPSPAQKWSMRRCRPRASSTARRGYRAIWCRANTWNVRSASASRATCRHAARLTPSRRCSTRWKPVRLSKWSTAVFAT